MTTPTSNTKPQLSPETATRQMPMCCTVSGAARALGIGRTTLRRCTAAHGGVFRPGTGPEGRPRYHADQVRLMAAVLSGLISATEASSEWDRRRPLAAAGMDSGTGAWVGERSGGRPRPATGRTGGE
jgi:hypothetical protein